MAIDRRQLNWLLAGLDFASAHERLYYRKASLFFYYFFEKKYLKNLFVLLHNDAWMWT